MLRDGRKTKGARGVKRENVARSENKSRRKAGKTALEGEERGDEGKGGGGVGGRGGSRNKSVYSRRPDVSASRSLISWCCSE